ncbi:MAG: nicotinate-nucleotide adenylyltransferase [Hespellia sp.]|jgi:nicotinate-nucleotide adenylyltransferase|nr:nicotinate-nucleotide adenylyltransferase [Hespellia sp.]
MKIGIMGGTFDPIHIGHLLLGEFAYEDFGLDEIWFLPNGNPPHKDSRAVGEDIEERVEMVRLAIHGVPYFRLSLYEATEHKESYTYQTMAYFKETYPEHDFYFILGADSLFSIEKWKYFREIFPSCTILAAMRDDKDQEDMERQIQYLTEKYEAKIALLKAPLLEISSTTIRERAAKGLTVRYMLPDLVAKYIREKGFYKNGESENPGKAEKIAEKRTI